MSEFIESRIAEHIGPEGQVAKPYRPLPAVSHIARAAQTRAALRVTEPDGRRVEPAAAPAVEGRVTGRLTEIARSVESRTRETAPVASVKPASARPVASAKPVASARPIESARPVATSVRPAPMPPPVAVSPRPSAARTSSFNALPARPPAPRPSAALPRPVAPIAAVAPIVSRPVAPTVIPAQVAEVARPIRTAAPHEPTPRSAGRPAPTPAEKTVKVYRSDESPSDRTDYRAIRF